jgi:hypothetical protein
MSTFQAPWALCGGWAVDAWLGRLTRDHGDIDIAVFVQDQQALFDHLAGWQLVAHDPYTSDDTSAPWDGRPLGVPGHLHCRLDTGEAMPERVDSAEEQGFGLDIQLNERSGEDCILLGEPRISLPLTDAVRKSPWGVPAVVPEALLFYKSIDLRRRDKLDFAELLPHLSADRRKWLREAIEQVGHPWVAQLQKGLHR